MSIAAFDAADAVAAELNGADVGTFSRAFTATRETLPEYRLEDLSNLKVSVVPKKCDVSPTSRATNLYEVAVDIGVQKKLGRNIDVEAEELVRLVDEIASYLARRKLGAMPLLTWYGTENDPIYVPEHMAESRVFTSVLTVNYRAMG